MRPAVAGRRVAGLLLHAGVTDRRCWAPLVAALGGSCRTIAYDHGQVAPEGRVSGLARELFMDMNGIALRAADPGPEHDPGPAWDRLAEISVPALVLCGDLDVVCLPSSAHLGSHIPGARHEVLEGTAHLPHLEGHERCLGAIAELVASV